MKDISVLRWAFVALAALVPLAIGLAACEGPQGRTGDPGGEPEFVTRIIVDNAVSVPLAGRITVDAAVYPETAIAQTLLWEISDGDSLGVIGLGRESESGFSMLSGRSVEVTGLSAGVARIVVTALGSSPPVSAIVTVTVE